MYLEVAVEAQRPVTYRLSRPEIAVGSLPSNEIVISSNAVSKNHLKIFFIDSEWFIMDVGSTNGTYLDAEALIGGMKVLFQEGSEVRLGDKVFLRLVEKPSSARVLELSEAAPNSSEDSSLEKTTQLSLEEFQAAELEARKRRNQRQKEALFIGDSQVMLKVGIAFVSIILLALFLNYSWRANGNLARDEFLSLPVDENWRGPGSKGK